MTTTTALPLWLETFFTDRLLRHQPASPPTLARSRATVSLLRRLLQRRLGKAPAAVLLDDLDAPVVSALRDHLAPERGTSARSRTVRLAAIHALFH